MAHGVSLELAKIPPNRFYNYQPPGGLYRTGPQQVKRDRMVARAQRNAVRAALAGNVGKTRRERMRAEARAVSNG